MSEKKETTDQDRIRDLHDCNSEIYKIIDRLNTIGIDIGLGFQNLREATINIQKSIGGIIDRMTNIDEKGT